MQAIACAISKNHFPLVGDLRLQRRPQLECTMTGRRFLRRCSIDRCRTHCRLALCRLSHTLCKSPHHFSSAARVPHEPSSRTSLRRCFDRKCSFGSILSLGFCCFRKRICVDPWRRDPSDHARENYAPMLHLILRLGKLPAFLAQRAATFRAHPNCNAEGIRKLPATTRAFRDVTHNNLG